jgi:hypothetical protein
MFLNAIKLFFAKRILRNRQSSNTSSPQGSKNNRIGILINASEVESVEQVILYLKLIFPTSYHVEVLVYTENKQQVFEDHVQSFSLKDLDLFAGFKSNHLQDFANKDFDFLINYYKNPAAPLVLVSHQSKAKMQVGFQADLPLEMILMIDTNPALPEVFFKTLHQYLTLTKLI